MFKDPRYIILLFKFYKFIYQCDFVKVISKIHKAGVWKLAFECRKKIFIMAGVLVNAVF